MAKWEHSESRCRWELNVTTIVRATVWYDGITPRDQQASRYCVAVCGLTLVGRYDSLEDAKAGAERVLRDQLQKATRSLKQGVER